jgi:hypothetical protein
MKNVLRNILLVAFAIVALMFFIGLANKPSESEERAKFEYNKAHCAQQDLVYVRKDSWDKGECVSASQAASQIIQMHKDQLNNGLK